MPQQRKARKRPSQAEDELRRRLTAIVNQMLNEGHNPYHIANALGHVRWDILESCRRHRAATAGLLPEALRVRVSSGIRRSIKTGRCIHEWTKASGARGKAHSIANEDGRHSRAEHGSRHPA